MTKRARRLLLAAALGLSACAEPASVEMEDDEAYGPGDFEGDDEGADTIPEQFPEGLPEPAEPATSPQSAPLQHDDDIGRLDPDLPGQDPSPFAPNAPDMGPSGPRSGPGGPIGERGLSGPVDDEPEEP